MLVDDIKKYYSQSKSVATGTQKTCKVNKGLAYLTDLKPLPPSNYDRTINQFTRKQSKTQHAIDLGVNTPKLVCAFLSNGHMVEVQEQAPGDILFSYSQDSAKYKFLNDVQRNLPENRFFNSLMKEKQKEFNYKQLRILANAPQEHYNKLFADAKVLACQAGCSLGDIHCENLNYDTEKGFYFLDLYFPTFIEMYSDFDVFDETFVFLRDIVMYYEDTPSVFENEIKQHMGSIIKKCLNATINNNFNIEESSFSENRFLILRCCGQELGNSILQEYYAKKFNKQQ